MLNRMRLGMPVSVRIARYANPEGRRAVIDLFMHQRPRVTARCDPFGIAYFPRNGRIRWITIKRHGSKTGCLLHSTGEHPTRPMDCG